MDITGTVDQDDITRARTILLASGRRTPYEEVDAYRVLARVGPAAYLPRLVRALHALSSERGHGSGYCERPAARLALLEEAVAAARAVDPAEPGRAQLLHQALDFCQRDLYAMGRRAEGLALRAEMLAVGRAQAAADGGPVSQGVREWAAGLSEEGRCAEAVELLGELVAASLPDGPGEGTLAWLLLEWIGALHDAGRADEALAAFEGLVTMEAAEAAADRGPVACHAHALIGYARMLDTWGRGERATVVRKEARAVLTELATTGERRSWSGYQASFWVVLLSLSGADSERPASGEPRPPLGVQPRNWSPDVRQRYFDSRTALREEVDALAARAAEAPDGPCAEQVRLHRVLTVRSAVHAESLTHLFAERTRHLFDEGVDLARGLARHRSAEGTRALADVLIDRSAFRLVAGEFGLALDDFREASGLLGDAG
ncbi:hypothetical protein EF908_21960 [Streptomyces sp. WAC04770]|nr:hypothetical protein [Streptomyces sp. WAC04770]RST21461.1 hypothetical protein EF908_21960 [Streptomyces sp. WAC04770]